jgi:hypothetical protein
MTDLTRIFDSYNRQARLYPALLVLLPPLLLALAWFPVLVDTGKIIFSIAVACGLLFLLADISRTGGKKLETVLLREWGGWPTTLWLRYSDRNLSADVKRRYHAFLSKQPGIGALPSESEEKNNPSAADERYAASVMWLKERCRGAAFPLVEKENATYGFRRNLVGMKSSGLFLSLATVLIPLAVAGASVGFHISYPVPFVIGVYSSLSVPVLGAVLLSLGALVAWLLVARHGWVREAGDQYARALLACCDSFNG